MTEQSPRRSSPASTRATATRTPPTTRRTPSEAAAAPARVSKSAGKKSAGKKSAGPRPPKSTPDPKPGVAGPTTGSKTVRRQGGTLAAGAARASGERRRRTGTPLLGQTTQQVTASLPPAGQAVGAVAPPEPDGSSTVHPSASGRASEPGAVASPPTSSRPPRSAIAEARARRSRRLAATAEGGPARLRSVPTPAAASPVQAARAEPADSAPNPEFSTEFSTEFTTDLSDDGADAAVPAGTSRDPGAGVAASLQSRAEKLVGTVFESAEHSSVARPGPRELVELAVNVLRSAAASAGLPTDEVEAQVARGLAYLRRRLTGDYTVDEFGFDEDYTLNVHLPALRPFYRTWFRVETRGIENIPDTGGALLVANHSGTIAFDSLMTQVAVHDEHPKARHLRMLGADLVFSTPFVGSMARRSGTTLAGNSDAQRLLSGGHLVGVWPEGFKGIGKPFTERYKLQRFGRGGFVAAALRAGVPIVPVSIVGAEEIYPILGDVPALARLLGMPYAPVTATWPLLGPLGLIPLPSKWLIEFGPPIDTSGYGPEAADDPMLVFDLTDQVRETIQQTLYSLLMQRRSIFF